jgi:hypothetical protein
MNKPNMPEAGPGRWWDVTVVKNAATKPIKVTLMESQVPGRKGLSSPLGYSRTIATAKAVETAADLVLVQVGGYADVIGQYGNDAPEEKPNPAFMDPTHSPLEQPYVPPVAHVPVVTPADQRAGLMQSARRVG